MGPKWGQRQAPRGAKQGKYYTPLPMNWTSHKQALHDTDFGDLRASKATGKVGRLFAHTWPLQNPLCRPPWRATHVGEEGGDPPKTGPNGPKTTHIGTGPCRGVLGPGPRRFVADQGRMASSWGAAAPCGASSVARLGPFWAILGAIGRARRMAVSWAGRPESRFRGHFPLV